jgi:alkylation response protein AidB-like acyl-CoA dehydrogenase
VVNLHFPPEAEAFRAEVRAFLAANLPADWAGLGRLDKAEADAFVTTWRRTLAENGFIGITWPTEYGGGGRSKLDQVVLAEEFAKAGVPIYRVADTTSVKMLGNTLVHWGTDAQKRQFLPGIISGDATWVQGYSEPESGSDLASVRLQARADGDAWIVNGQKLWTSRGMDGTGIFLLARTDATVAKHRGITFLLCELPTEGVEVRPIRTLTGDDEFCEVFFTDARIPIGNVVGPVNDGWKVANSLLGLERGEEAATNPIFFRAELDRIVQLARDRGLANDPVMRDRLAWCHMKVETMRFLGYRTLTGFLRDGKIGPEASISKLYWSEYHQVAADLAVSLLGAHAMVREGRKPFKHFRTDEPGAANTTNSWIDVLLMNARAGTVYAGTSQVQRNILAENILGLPKEPVPDPATPSGTRPGASP